MNTSLFKNYADIRKQIDELSQMEEALKIAILEEMRRNKEIKAEFEYGKFTVGTRKNYIYTARVIKAEENLKLLKLKEVERGAAGVKETNYITFKSK